MKDLIKKLTNLSALESSENEISDFCDDFSDILPLINTISDFDLTESDIISEKSFSILRSDIPKKSNFNFNTKSVPKVIS